MAPDLYREIRRRSLELEEETAATLARLVRTPSFSTREKEVIALIRRDMEAIGLDEVRTDALGSVIGRIGAGPRPLAFDAHVDTVRPGEAALWESDPFSGEIAAGRVRGRGAADQKGGMASMLAAARIITEMDLNDAFTIYFTGTVMEEDCDGLCWLHLIREEGIHPELVVITEPTDLRLHRGQRGRMEIAVRIGGLSCHASAPDRGDNALYKMSRIALEIEKLNERLPDDPFLGKGTVAATQFFFSSPSQCAVPDGAVLQLDRRLTRGETRESALAGAREAARRAGHPEARVEVLRYDEPSYTGLRYPMVKYYPSWVLDEGSPWLASAVRAYEGVLGREPVVDRWTFSTNGVAIAGLHDIPCLGLGPGSESEAHAPNESCPVGQLSEAAAFYAALVAHLNGRC